MLHKGTRHKHSPPSASLWLVALPESPLFLVQQCRVSEALAVLRRMYASNTGKLPQDYPVRRWPESRCVTEQI